MAYRLISYFTVNTPYEQEVMSLRESLEKFQIPNKIYPKQSRGQWSKNTQIKASVILEAMGEFPNENIVWLDADAVLEKRPEFFDSLKDFDLCCYYLQTRYNPHELLSGTIVFANNETMRGIVREWINLNEHNSEWDQRNLQIIIESEKYKSLRILPLPKEYIKITGHEKHQPGIDPGDVVIRHNQASRRFKGKIK